MSETVFKSVKFKNFMSFGNSYTDVDLTHHGLTLIMGENLDKGGSSGAGKTTLLSVISWLAYDKIPSGVSKEKMINKTNLDKKAVMEGELVIVRGGVEYIVKRWRGASTGVQLFENGKDVTPDSIANFNAKVIEIIGLSYLLFTLVVIFSGNNKLFLDSSVGEQRTLIEELFKVTTLTQKAAALKKLITATDKDIALKKQLIEQQRLQNEQYQKRVADAHRRVVQWTAQHESDIVTATKDAERLASIDFDSEEQLHQTIAELDATASAIAGEVREIESAKSARSRERSPKVTELTLAGSEIASLEKTLKKLKGEESHLRDAKCPYCLQDYAGALAKLAEIEREAERTSGEVEVNESKRAALQAEVDEFNEEVKRDVAELEKRAANKTSEKNELASQANELREALTFKNFKDHVNASKLISTLQDRIEKLLAEENPHVEALESLQTEGEIEIDTVSLDEAVKLQEHQQFLLKLLTDKNSFVRKNIIAKTIPFLNQRIGYYTERLNLPHVALFQPDMTCQITQYGRELDHGNLSNGEKKILNLALCFAFRDVLTYLHSRVNVLFTDEVDGGSISGPDVDAMIKTLHRKARDDRIGIFVISHRPEFEGHCDRYITVQKEGGFSTLSVHLDY